MSRATLRLTDGRRLVAPRLPETIRLTLDGEEIGVLSLRSAWRGTRPARDRTGRAASSGSDAGYSDAVEITAFVPQPHRKI